MPSMDGIICHRSHPAWLKIVSKVQV